MPCVCALSDSEEEDDGVDGQGGEGNHPPVTMAGVGPPPVGPECLVQAVLLEVLVILVSSGDKHADRAVVEAVWELLHEFDAMCQLLSNIRSPCLPLAKASMQLLTKMHHSKRFSIGPRSILQVRALSFCFFLFVLCCKKKSAGLPNWFGTRPMFVVVQSCLCLVGGRKFNVAFPLFDTDCIGD